MPRPSDIGFRTFDEINATMAAVTGVSPNTPAVKSTFTSIRQSLPAVDSIEAFLASHQTAIAQLAIQYCDALVESPQATSYFPGLNLDGAPATVFGSNARQGPADRSADQQHDRHERHVAAECRRSSRIRTRRRTQPTRSDSAPACTA